jgi:ADP-heptose:LPS heptosyltransferase
LAVSAPRRPRIVALRALKLGDLLAAVPALRALHRHLPEHEVVLAGPAGLEPLACHTGAVDRVVDTPGLVALAGELRHAEIAVNLHGRGPRSTALLAATSPRRLIAFDRAGPPWLDGEHERHRWCRLLLAAGIAADPSDLHLAPPPLALPPGRAGAVVVHPGASRPARQWPVQRWAAVCRALAASGHRVVVTGSDRERRLGQALVDKAQLPETAFACGQTDVLALAAVVASATCVLSGDTGIAHLAYAFGTPSVTLFGPTAPAAWGPPSDGPHWSLWAGRVGDPHSDELDSGLAEITVADVLAATLACLDTSVSRAAHQ